MADLNVNNPPSPPEMQPWPFPLPMPLHQLSITYSMNTSCLAQISPFFPRLCLNFFKHPSIFPAGPQGFAPPPGFASTMPCPAAIDNYGAYRFPQSGRGFYGGGGPCFLGPYGYLCLPPIQFQLKVYERLQTGTPMEQRERRNRVSQSERRIVEVENRGTGVFHGPDNSHGPGRYKKRRRRRGNRRNENGGGEERRPPPGEEEGMEQQQEEEEEEEGARSELDYEVVLPSEWPY